ncbi:MAG: hypothetical protein ACRDY0_11720 [Acidimicrobiales bacterium]
MIVVVAVVVVLVGVAFARRASSDSLAMYALRRLLDLSPPAQKKWIAAMLAEVDYVADPRQRRRFARGCLRAAAFSGRRADSTGVWVSGLVGV